MFVSNDTFSSTVEFLTIVTETALDKFDRVYLNMHSHSGAWFDLVNGYKGRF